MERISPVTFRRAAIVTLLAVVLVASGCRKKSIQAMPSAPLPAEVHTAEQVPPPEVTGTPEKAVPTLTLPTPAPAPPRPRPRGTPAPTEPEAATTEPSSPKPEPPRISPRYTPAEEAQLRDQTNRFISQAERNLQRMNGQKLTPSQSDLAEKIRGFLAQSREAIGAGDWFRAQNLASKAQVLSQELVRSL